MSDWIERLDARRRGDETNFHGADTPLEDVDRDELPDVQTPAGIGAAQAGEATPRVEEPPAPPYGDGAPPEGV